MVLLTLSLVGIADKGSANLTLRRTLNKSKGVSEEKMSFHNTHDNYFQTQRINAPARHGGHMPVTLALWECRWDQELKGILGYLSS